MRGGPGLRYVSRCTASHLAKGTGQVAPGVLRILLPGPAATNSPCSVTESAAHLQQRPNLRLTVIKYNMFKVQLRRRPPCTLA